MKLSHGSGSYLWMEGDEQPYLDFIMAYGSTNFGHAHPKIVHAVQKAASLVDNTSPYGYTPRRELTQSLVDQLPYAVEAHQIHCIEGGARAVEAAIEMTRIISGRRKVISFVGAFHGYASSVIGISDLAFFLELMPSTKITKTSSFIFRKPMQRSMAQLLRLKPRWPAGMMSPVCCLKPPRAWRASGWLHDVFLPSCNKL